MTWSAAALQVAAEVRLSITAVAVASAYALVTSIRLVRCRRRRPVVLLDRAGRTILGTQCCSRGLEPDALAMADCLSPEQRQERFDLLLYTVDTLTINPSAAVYVDAGHSRWLSAEEMAARLNEVGVDHVRGFSLNTSNFYTTDEEIGYGEAVSALTNGSHYVIDTSRNGAGPAPDTPLNWCNPR